MNCCEVFRTLRWKENLSLQVASCLRELADKMNEDTLLVINAEYVSRITLKILYEILLNT